MSILQLIKSRVRVGRQLTGEPSIPDSWLPAGHHDLASARELGKRPLMERVQSRQEV